jgi:signal transduction histidine kinase/ActR/RegA family two-component response regulator
MVARSYTRSAVKDEEDAIASRSAEAVRLDLVIGASELGLWYCDLPSAPPAPGPDRVCGLLAGLRASARFTGHFGLPESAPPTPADLDARLHPDDRAAVRAAVERAIAAPGSFDVELRTVGLDERVRWIRAIGAVSVDAAGRPVRFDGVTVEVTEQKAIEEALQESARRKDDFLALLGHELRNPLAPIRNSLAILGLPNVSPEAAAKARTMMERQLGHLTRLVDDLLDVSRISRGKIELKRTTFDLVGLVRSTVEDHRPAAEARGLALTAELAPERLEVHADATRVAQSFGNLLQNALKFTPPSGRITVRLAGHEGLAALEVEDTGIGMDAATLQHVFEPFRQADHHRGGLGLGLAVAQRLVELNRGTLEVTSPGLGKGSRFRLMLPLAEKNAGAAAPAPPPALAVNASRRRVLIVEDNLDAADSLATFLQMIGHEVAVAYDGPSGVERALGFAPEIVLCDIDLPGFDGYAVAAALREEPALRGTYLVAMTGYGQADDKRRARETGFDAHLTKPTDPAALERLLARLPAAALAVATPSVEKTFF